MATTPNSPVDETKVGRAQWMALAAAVLGWLFDGLEMGLFPLVGRPALQDLIGTTDEKIIGGWFAVATAVFLVGAATGGVFFGWLGDRIGRVRAMMLSVATYAIFTGACGLAQTAEWIAILRFVAALGMGGEWSLGVALVNEIWPDRSRAFLAALIGAAANVGFLLIGIVGIWVIQMLPDIGRGLMAIGLSEENTQWLIRNSGWRLMLMLGAVPALLTFFIRLFVPESERWEREKGKGTTSHWASRDLLGVLIGAVATCSIIYLWSPGAERNLTVQIAGTVIAVAVATVGYLYPVVRFLQRSYGSGGGVQPSSQAWTPITRRMLLGATLGGVALLGTWGSVQWAPVWVDKLTEGVRQQHESELAKYRAYMETEIIPPLRDAAKRFFVDQPGGATPEMFDERIRTDPTYRKEVVELRRLEADVARLRSAKEKTQIWSALGAIVGTIIGAYACNWLGRRPAYALLCIGSIGSVLLLYRGNTEFGWPLLASMFLAGMFTAAFYGWLPLYLPELFPTKVRATGQGFSFNFGRILAAIGALQTGNLMKLLSGTNVTGAEQYAHACSIMAFIYVVGLVVIWLAPETRGKPLPE